jgi:polar amino acid transport system permease protein
MYHWDFDIVIDNAGVLLRGCVVTLELTVISLVLASLLGLAFGLGSLSRSPLVRWPCIGFVEVFRAAPALIVLIWIYYALPVLVGVNLSSFVSAVLGLTLVQTAYEAEIFRAGIEAIERGQIEAARSLGMSGGQTMRRIVLPQAVQIMIPPFISTTAGLLKYSSLASVIAVYELLNQGTNLIQQSFRPLEVYTAVAILYLAMILPISQASRVLEHKLKKLTH